MLDFHILQGMLIRPNDGRPLPPHNKVAIRHQEKIPVAVIPVHWPEHLAVLNQQPAR